MEIRHGYSLADVDRMARLATHIGPVAMDYSDRCDEAWAAIVEHLYSADGWPAEHDLVWIGRKAIYDMVTSDRRERGYYRLKTDGITNGAGSSPAFVAFWEALNRPSPAAERHVVDRFALWQILPTLRPHELDALVALAALDDYQAAAVALGVGPGTFKSQIARARKAFLALWHE